MPNPAQLFIMSDNQHYPKLLEPFSAAINIRY
jgi:hypothetical protein